MDVVVTGGGNKSNSAFALGRDKNFVVREESVFIDGAEDIALRENVTLLDFGRFEAPDFGGIEGRNVNTSGDVYGLGVISDDLEGSLDTVKDLIEDTGTKLDGEGLFGSFDWITHSQAG